MEPVRRHPGEREPLYGATSDLFSVRINHGGFFCGFGKKKTYVDGQVAYFDGCHVDTWSPLWIKDFIEQLGYMHSKCQVYWLLPGKNLDEGLRIIDSDSDTIAMASVVPKFQIFALYVDHKNDLYNNIVLDDVCIVGSPELPAVLSPMKPGLNIPERSNPRVKTQAEKGKRRMQSEVADNGDSSSDDSGSDWVDSDNDLAQDDDDLFEEWVDEVHDKKKAAAEMDSDYDSEDMDLPCSDKDESEHEEVIVVDATGRKTKKKKKKKIKLTSFRPEEMRTVSFHLGMVFPTVVQLRKAIQEYVIQNRVPIMYAKNDKQRVRAHCDEECSWFLYAAPDTRTESWIVKAYVGEHTCSREWELKQFTARYLAGRYVESFRADDKMSLKNFARIVQMDFNMTPSRSKLARARRLAMKEIHGDELKQYNMLWDYSAEIRRSNPGSSMFLNLSDGKFSTLYMSLDACKRGLLAGCRPIIFIDGCHLKTKFGGQLLTAVGVDPNNCIFPTALAVVEVEDTPTWKWFLQTLIEDLGIQNTGQWTIMSDRQKGLINAVNALFPDSAHRFCVRHLHQNFAKKWKGDLFKNKLWAIARSYTHAEWTKNMEEMKELDQEAYDYLEAIEPSAWCRAFFSEFPKCDILLNNNCEVFNKYILDARELPILTMLEKIKNQLMTRFYSKNKECEEWAGPICPKIRKKLDKQAKLASNCFCLPAGRGVFQVTGLRGQYTVDIHKDECTCRMWQLTGIPCRHAIGCLRHERIKPEDKVSPCYKISAFKQAYGQVIMPCRDQTGWKKMNGVEVKPPKYDKVVGRPKLKRKRNPVEDDEQGTRMSRHGTIGHCSACNQPGHNKRRCPALGRGAAPATSDADHAADHDTASDADHEAASDADHAAAQPEDHAAAQPEDHDAARKKLPVKRRIVALDGQPEAHGAAKAAAAKRTSTNQDKAQNTKRTVKRNIKAKASPSIQLSGITDFQGVSEQNISVLEILSQGVSTQQSQAPAPLPESNFIATCREGMPVPRATTATLGLGGQKRGRTIPKKKKA